ncbi:MAG: peptide chain release factor 1 [Sphaerobacteraceae bacterium]|nr:MAG: peptide chain release factor 1 [Sphaerobacteraceae bacterium]
MIKRSDLQKISKLDSPKGQLVSLYLPLFQDSNDTDYNIKLKNLLRSADQRYKHEAGKELPDEFDDLFEDIRVYIRDNSTKYGRGIALFATPGKGILASYSMPDTIESSAIVDERANIAPLIRLIEDYAPYCTCIISRDHARMLIGKLDEIEEHSQLEDDEVPGQHDQGGWSQSRYERHIEDHVHRHFKRVAQQLFDMLENNEYHHLILGGPEEVVSGFEETLHQYVTDRVIGHVRILKEANINDVRQNSMDVLEQHITDRKQRLIDAVESESAAGDLGVKGLAATMEALQRGQVMNLIVDHEIRSSGVVCQSCGAMSVTPGEGNTCSYCQASDIRDMDNVIPALITSAFEQGASIAVIDQDDQQEQIGKLGGIGATLRFRVEE